MSIGTAFQGVPARFLPSMILYHLLPIHMPVTLFFLDAPFGRFSDAASKFKVNGNVSWFIMEIISPLTAWYTLLSNGFRLNANSFILFALYNLHYLHRAIVSPLVLSPPRSKPNILVPITAGAYNVLNGFCLTVGLACFPAAFTRRTRLCALGVVLGFLGNGVLVPEDCMDDVLTAVYHDEILNDLRRPEGAQVIGPLNKEEVEKDKKAGNGRYAIPRRGLFEFVSFPNYLCEWFEWTCFAYAAAPNFTIPVPSSPDPSLHPLVQRGLELSPWKPTALLHPAWIFVIFLVASMLPRALRAHKWYHDTFGERYPRSRKAVIPYIL